MLLADTLALFGTTEQEMAALLETAYQQHMSPDEIGDFLAELFRRKKKDLAQASVAQGGRPIPEDNAQHTGTGN